MKKTLRKTIILLLALVCSVCVFAACGESGNGVETDVNKLYGEYGIFVMADPINLFEKDDKLYTNLITEESDKGKTILSGIGDRFDWYEDLFIYDIYLKRAGEKLDYRHDVLVGVSPEVWSGEYVYAGALVYENDLTSVHLIMPQEGADGFLYFSVSDFSSVANPAYFVIARGVNGAMLQAKAVAVGSNSPADAGSIEANKSGDLEDGIIFRKGSAVTLEAVANDGYVFKGWAYDDDDRQIFSTERIYEFTINKNTSLVALFEEEQKEDQGGEQGGEQEPEPEPDPEPDDRTSYRLILTARGGGEIYDSNNEPTDIYANGQSLNVNTEIKLTAKAFDDYSFKGWYNSSDDSLISANATYTFKMTKDILAYALFEENLTYIFLAQCDVDVGGYITENGTRVDFGNGRSVDLGTQITLTAVANAGYEFRGWATRDEDWNAIIFSTNAKHTFTVNESVVDEYGRYYVQAIFHEKANGLRIDAHNAGFTYNESGELITTVYVIGSEIKPNIEYVGVYATYPSQSVQDEYLELNVDYTRDLGGLDFNKAGTYTVTYTYKADTSLTVSLTVQVVA